jgi:hypothetical protein
MAKPKRLNLARARIEEIERASPEAILDGMSNVQERFSCNVMIDVTRRLIDVIFFDDAASERDRQVARAMIDEVIKLVETAYAKEPDRLAAYRKAYREHIEGGRKLGIGRLA